MPSGSVLNQCEITLAAAVNAQASKRKATDLDVDDFENLDPTLFSKRSKGVASFFPNKESLKSCLLKAAKSSSSSSSPLPVSDAFASPAACSTPLKPQSVPVTPAASTVVRQRQILQPKSPAARLANTTVTPSVSLPKLSTNTPLSAPAGRSPTRGRRNGGILSSRRRMVSRVNPPLFGASFSTASAAPFSLDAALKGTVPSYSSSARSTPRSRAPLDISHDSSKDSWEFEIHEDTPEQEMTNLLQHGTCVLDISSDEESAERSLRDRAEGKENVPPTDDISQTSSRRVRARQLPDADALAGQKMVEDRSPLGEMDARSFYAEGCAEEDVIIVPGDDDDSFLPLDGAHAQRPAAPLGPSPLATVLGVDSEDSFQFAPELKIPESEQVAVADDAEIEPVAASASVSGLSDRDAVDAIMRSTEPAEPALVLEPMEGTGESFELWESGSAKDETEGAQTDAPQVDAIEATVPLAA